jgi:hypothetical protein
MPGTLTSLTTLRDTLATFLGQIAGLKVYPNGGATLDTLPAVEVKLPRIERVRPDEAESELGTVTWRTFWPLRVYVAADDIPTATDQALQMLALVVAKFDANETLGDPGVNLYCRVTDARESDPAPFGDSKPTRGYELTLAVIQLL